MCVIRIEGNYDLCCPCQFNKYHNLSFQRSFMTISIIIKYMGLYKHVEVSRLQKRIEMVNKLIKNVKSLASGHLEKIPDRLQMLQTIKTLV